MRQNNVLQSGMQKLDMRMQVMKSNQENYISTIHKLKEQVKGQEEKHNLHLDKVKTIVEK